MAYLTEEQRRQVWAEFMYSAQLGSVAGLLKTDLRAAVDGLDAYFQDNAAAINSAIPLPARTALTTKQKALLAMYVIARRFAVEI